MSFISANLRRELCFKGVVYFQECYHPGLLMGPVCVINMSVKLALLFVLKRKSKEFFYSVKSN